MKLMRLGLALALLCAPAAASASTLTFDYTVQFSNGVQPGGPSPWLTATFNDATASAGNDVRLTLAANGLAAGEFISNVYFNLNTSLTQAQVTSIVATEISDSGNAFGTFNASVNSYQADGDGLFDIVLGFNTSAGFRFEDGDTVVIDFNLPTGTLSAGSFNFSSAPVGGNSGPFFAAAHLQGIAPNASQSTWIADQDGGQGDCVGCVPNPTIGGDVPEPASLLLLGTGVVGLMARRRKK